MSLFHSTNSTKSVVLPEKLTSSTFKQVLDKQPYARLSLDQFKDLARVSNGWSIVREQDKTYNLAQGSGNQDEWFREALYQTDPSLLESVFGYNKAPDVGRAYHNLLKYSGRPVYRNQMDDRMNKIYEAKLEEQASQFSYVSTIPLEIAMTKIPLNTSAGYSFPGKKKGDVLHEAYAKVQGMIQDFKDNKPVPQIPFRMALRGHLSPVNENKTRVIWVAPIENVILENMFFRGFYYQIYEANHLKDKFLTGQGVMERLNSYLADKPDDGFTNSDVSGWDTIRARFVIMDVFNRILKPKMQLDEPWKLRCFEYLVDAFVYSHLLLPDGTVVKKHIGVPSGSFLTLLVNSLAVDNVCTSGLRYLGVEFHDTRVLGDDFCFKSFENRLDELSSIVADYVDVMLDQFVVTIKPEKVVVADKPNDRKFIGYQIKDGKLFRENHDLLCGMLYPESPVKNLSVSFTRIFAYMTIGGFNSDVCTRVYETYLTGYYGKLKSLGQDVFRDDIMRNGNLRVWKHVFHVDLDQFEGLDIDAFRKIHLAKVPYFLSNGIKYIM